MFYKEHPAMDNKIDGFVRESKGKMVAFMHDGRDLTMKLIQGLEAPNVSFTASVWLIVDLNIEVVVYDRGL